MRQPSSMPSKDAIVILSVFSLSLVGSEVAVISKDTETEKISTFEGRNVGVWVRGKLGEGVGFRVGTGAGCVGSGVGAGLGFGVGCDGAGVGMIAGS